MNRAKAKSNFSGASFLRDAFRDAQRVLEAHLGLAAESITHDGVMGAVGESHWIDVFGAYLPNRYGVSSGIIMDCDGQTSEQIDIVVFDAQYSPALLTQKDHTYIPAEAVYAVLEAKPDLNKQYLEYAGKKAASVRRLRRTSASIPHAGGVYSPKEHFEIVAGIVSMKCAWVDGLGVSFKRNLPQESHENRIDCGCALTAGAFDCFENGQLTISTADGSLMYFLFRLLNKLQSLGTVPAIDWSEYTRTFEEGR